MRHAEEVVQVTRETMVEVPAVAGQVTRRRSTGNGKATAADAHNHTPAYFIQTGQALQRKGVESTLELAALLAEAYKQLDADGYKEVLAELGYSHATASKFRTIAASPILNDISYRKFLPAYWVTLYHLALLGKQNEAALRGAIEDGTVNPNLEQQAAIDYVDGKRHSGRRKPESNPQDPTPAPTLTEPYLSFADACIQHGKADVLASHLRTVERANPVSPDRFRQSRESVEAGGGATLMRTFFLYFGGKWKKARHLGRPQRDHVIEPFAGSAGYSCYWNPPMVTLVERDPVIYGIWHYLQRVSPDEILRLPVNIDSVDQLPPSVCQEARHLVGMWFNRAVAYPVPRRSAWARQPRYAAMFWSETIALRIASQLPKIRHWKIIHGDWWNAPDVEAHWHIDPPYTKAGRHYRFNGIDREALADWCRTRKGFVQVCEGDDADWLPFEPFMRNASHPRVRRFRHSAGEALFELENARSDQSIVRAAVRRRRA